MSDSLIRLQRDIHRCDRCPRLRKHCQTIAQTRRRAYIDEEYWGRPISGFGDPGARLVIVGLAPAAHGANRTGRIFTGDRSGDWLYRALHKAGFANQPTATHSKDGLELRDAYVTCVVRCAPPDNKPSPLEIETCSAFLDRELELLSGNARVFLALGQIGLTGLWLQLKRLRWVDAKAPRPRFAHGAKLDIGAGRWVLMSYHPSQQNTFTGRLTEPMFDSVFSTAKRLLGSRSAREGRS